MKKFELTLAQTVMARERLQNAVVRSRAQVRNPSDHTPHEPNHFYPRRHPDRIRRNAHVLRASG